MEKAKLIAAIVERHKVRLDEDDPAFILVDLNQIALDESVERMADIFSGLTDEIKTASGRMNLQTSQLREAGDRYEKLVTALVDETKRSIIKAAEAAKQDQLRELEQAMTAAAAVALQAAINEQMRAPLASFNASLADAVKGINEAAAVSVANVNGAADNVKASAKRWLWIAPLGGLLAVLIFFAGHWFFGKSAAQAAPQLTLEQQQEIDTALGLQRAWPKLDQKAKSVIENELQKR